MPGTFDQYPWDGAQWDGAAGGLSVISTAHSFCFVSLISWEFQFEGITAVWMTDADALQISATAEWEKEVMGAIPEC